MAVIYIDAFSVTLQSEVSAAATELELDEDAAARISASMAWAQNVPQSSVGPLFMRLAMFLDDGTQRELVFVTHEKYPGTVAIERTAGLAFAPGATLRCAPPAETVAAGHMAKRVGAGSEVIAAPGERGVLATEATYIGVRVASGPQTRPHFAGHEWPSEVVLHLKGVAADRTVEMLGYGEYSPKDFLLAGAGPGAQSSLLIPSTCKVAVLTVRVLPTPLGGFVAELLVSAEFY